VKLFLRLYADCESQEQAKSIDDRIRLALSHLSASQFAPFKPYWKIPSQFEFTYTLEPATTRSFESIIAASSGGWSRQLSEASASAVWNRQSDHILLVPEASWGNVELYEAAP
jgi:hypothetical protein